MITEQTHPFIHDIVNAPVDNLINRRRYVFNAVEAWRENKYNATKESQEYNINYFEVELNIIDKELKKHDNTK